MNKLKRPQRWGLFHFMDYLYVMDFARLTKRINRKLGAEVLTEHGVKIMWSIADDKFSSYLYGDVFNNI